MNHLVIFARAPQLGHIKQRLAHDIGSVQALRFYRTNLFTLIRRLSGGKGWTTWIAVTPDISANSHRLWPPNVRRLSQGAGNIGNRMARCMLSFGSNPVVLVGSDIPEIDKCHVSVAFTMLRKNDLVFGPSNDGGYWLVGAAKGARTASLFEDVRWSTKSALDDTLGNVKQGERVGRLETLSDIDDGPSYINWRKQGRTLISI